MAVATTRPPRVESLTGLRWWAAFAVFVHHVTNLTPNGVLKSVGWLGVSGVSFFFVLSGFVLTWSWDRQVGTRRFYWRRFARIYPLHLLTTALALPVFYGLTWDFQKTWDWTAIALSVVLLHAWSPNTGIYFGGNPASWSLSDEAFFYAVHPLLARLFIKVDPRRCAAIAVTAIGAMWLIFIAVVVAKPSGTAATLLLRPPTYRFWEFLLGVAVGIALRNGWKPRVRVRTAGLLLTCAMVGLVVWSQVDALNNVVRGPNMLVQVLAPFYALLIAAVAARDIRQEPSRLRSARLVALGQWSFAFYLVHATVIYAMRGVLGGPIRPLTEQVAVASLALGISIAIAAALYRFVEHPLEARLRAMYPIAQREAA